MADPHITLKTKMAHLEGRKFSFSLTLTHWLGETCLHPTRKKPIISELSKRRYDIAIILFPLPPLRLPNIFYIFLHPAAPKKIK